MGSPTAALVVELYQGQASDASVAQADLRSSAVARLNRARSQGVADISNPGKALDQLPESYAALARARVSSGSSASSSSGSSSSSGGSGGAAATLGQSPQLASQLQSDAESKSSLRGLGGGDGVALVHLGVARFPLRHMPEDRSGMITELDGEVVGVRARGAGGVQEGWPCVVEVQAWDAAQYSAEQLKAGPQAEQPLPVGPNIDLALIATPSYVGHMMSIVTQDLLSKQAALEKLQRAVLRAEGSSELGRWRVHEAEKRNGVLAADLAQLRKLLHEEKSSGKVSNSSAPLGCAVLLFLYLILIYHNIVCYIILHNSVSHYSISHDIIACYIILYYVYCIILYYVILHYVKLCYVMLCYVILHYIVLRY